MTCDCESTSQSYRNARDKENVTLENVLLVASRSNASSLHLNSERIKIAASCHREAACLKPIGSRFEL